MRGVINFGLLLQGCKDGNPTSQAKLFEYFYGYGMNISLRYTNSYSEAEEILNDSFLMVFKSIDKYDPRFPFKLWFRKIIVNKSIDYFRKFKRYKSHHVNQELPDVLEEASQPYISQNDDVLPIIQQLTPMYRMVFNLYVMEEYKHHEIAEKLNISVGTSKSNLARAKARLKQLWIEKKMRNKKTKKR